MQALMMGAPGAEQSVRDRPNRIVSGCPYQQELGPVVSVIDNYTLLLYCVWLAHWRELHRFRR